MLSNFRKKEKDRRTRVTVEILNDVRKVNYPKLLPDEL